MSKLKLPDFDSIVGPLSYEAQIVFDTITHAVMDEFEPGEVSQQDILDALEAMLKITKLAVDQNSQESM